MENFQGVSGAALTMRNVIIAHGEFVIGLKRANQGKPFFPQMVHHTHTFARRAHIVRRLQYDFCNFELQS
jgi:hypothetical protein